MELESDVVRSGEVLLGTVTFENSTDRPIVDAHCSRSSASHGIASADNPDQPLWLLISAVDCGRATLIAPGHRSTTMRDFRAVSFILKGGQELEPGNYIAFVNYDDHPRLDVPFRVIP